MMLGRGRCCRKSGAENDRNCKRDICLDQHVLDFLMARFETAKAHRGNENSVLRCVTVEDKVASFDDRVAGKAGVLHRRVGRFAVVKLSETPAACRGIFA